MAILPQAPGQGLVQQPTQAFIDTSLKGSIFGSKFNEGRGSLDTDKDFSNYLGRIHHRYKDMDTSNIKNLVSRLLQDPDSTFMNRVREETSLKDTLKNRFVEAKTPLGQVLQELQNSQESPNRKLLSKEIFNKAEKEAGELTKKEVALVAEKGSRREVSNEVSRLLKRQSIVYGKIGPEFQVNTYSVAQSGGATTSLSNGKFAVTWTQDSVYGQIFNADGTKRGSEFQINTYVSNFGDSSIASLSSGKFVVTWTSDAQDGSGDGVYGQICNADGTKSGSEFQINTYVASDQGDSSVASLSNGNFVVTWTSAWQDGDDDGVYGQIFNADGTKRGSEFQINTTTQGKQESSSVTSLSNGNFVVTWAGWPWGRMEVYGQIFNADGTKSGFEFPVNTAAASGQTNPSVANLRNGKFVVTWESPDQGGDGYGISGQIFSGDGTKSGSEFPVNTYVTGYQQNPAVSSLSNDQFIVAWQGVDQDGSAGLDIFGQVFNADGTKSGLEFLVNTDSARFQSRPFVAALDNGNKFIVTWNNGFIDTNGQIFGTDINNSTSGAERQISGITPAALSWIKIAVKNALGY